MKINSQFVGTRFKPLRMQIHWRDTMNNTAAIDDDNALYFDVYNRDGQRAVSHGYALLDDGEDNGNDCI